MRQIEKDSLTVRIYGGRAEMGREAERDISAKIRELTMKKGEIRMVFAAAPSQNEVLAALAADKSIPWHRVHAFHMDEYIGLPADAPQGFGRFLREHLFGLVPFGSVNLIDISAADPEAEAARYSALLAEAPIDIVVMGIGENGHIAFNDPPVADFGDPLAVKAVALDPVCRQQQVNDGCFESLGDVPTHALTLTVPTLMSAAYHFCIVPAATKADAVYETLNGEISEHCPASVLRTKKSTMYLDNLSSSRL